MEADLKENKTTNESGDSFSVDWGQVLKLKDSVEVRAEDGGGIVFDRETEQMCAIDPVGHAILTAAQGMTLREIFDAVCKKYPNVDHDTLKSDFLRFIERVSSALVGENKEES